MGRVRGKLHALALWSWIIVVMLAAMSSTILKNVEKNSNVKFMKDVIDQYLFDNRTLLGQLNNRTAYLIEKGNAFFLYKLALYLQMLPINESSLTKFSKKVPATGEVIGIFYQYNYLADQYPKIFPKLNLKDISNLCKFLVFFQDLSRAKRDAKHVVMAHEECWSNESKWDLKFEVDLIILTADISIMDSLEYETSFAAVGYLSRTSVVECILEKLGSSELRSMLLSLMHWEIRGGTDRLVKNAMNIYQDP